MKKKTITIMIMLAMLCGVVAILQGNKTDHHKKTGRFSEKQSFAVVKENWNADIEQAKQGKYSNLNIIKIDNDIDDIEALTQIDLIKNKEYLKRTNRKNLEIMDQTINNFFEDQFDMSVVNVNYCDPTGEWKKMPYGEYKQQVDSLEQDPYFLMFGDERENGGRGFLQIDSSNVQVWFSRGNIPATMPLYHYETKKTYNLTISTEGWKDNVQLADGEITIEDAVRFVEYYLNNGLPYEKNKDFNYEVAEVRVLDVDGQDALGFCVRKKYQQISFDYIDGITDNDFNSEYFDDRGEVCMIRKGEVDSLCGLGGDIYDVEKTSEPLVEILTLDDALSIVSTNIGDNSVYDVYGIEMVYQFKELQGEDRYKGRLVWKIITRNRNDDKNIWFYVDVESGELDYRYKQSFGM